VRAATPEDLVALPAIELSGEAMFAEFGIVFPPGPATVETAIADGASILVAGDPAVAFAAVIELDGHPHLEQISVRADKTRKGVGTLLLGEVVRRFGPGLTLLTFRDVPWNGPWYIRHGFVELPESAWGPQLRGHWRAEIDAGLHDLGPRLVMHHPKGPGAWLASRGVHDDGHAAQADHRSDDVEAIRAVAIGNPAPCQ
jgi:GNAT superfamily N-acetyltransferase